MSTVNSIVTLLSRLRTTSMPSAQFFRRIYPPPIFSLILELCLPSLNFAGWHLCSVVTHTCLWCTITEQVKSLREELGTVQPHSVHDYKSTLAGNVNDIQNTLESLPSQGRTSASYSHFCRSLFNQSSFVLVVTHSSSSTS